MSKIKIIKSTYDFMCTCSECEMKFIVVKVELFHVDVIDSTNEVVCKSCYNEMTRI